MSIDVTGALFWLPLTTGVLFLIVGLIFHRYPPKKVNGGYGYRTPRSMKSQEAWDLAQPMAARETIWAGVTLMAASCLGLFWNPGEKLGALVGALLMVAAIARIFIKVEVTLKREFG